LEIVAVKVTVTPNVDGVLDVVTPSVGVALFTVWVSPLDVTEL